MPQIDATAADASESRPNARLRPLAWWWLAASCLAYATLELVPGRFMAVDEVFYKAAGRNWAMTGHFAAPEIVGFLGRTPSQVFFAQPPLYPFLFGLYTRLVGFGPRLNILFDVLIHIALAWSVLALGRYVFRLSATAAAVAGMLVLPLGYPGRSDELAMIFIFWAAIALCALPRRWAAPVGGALIGVSLATSLSAIVFLAPLLALEWWRHVEPHRRAREAGTLMTAALLMLLACVAPILAPHPEAIWQLLRHGSTQSGTLSTLRHNPGGLAGSLARGWSLYRFGLGNGVGIDLAAALVFGAAAWALGATQRAAGLDRFAVGAAVSGLLFLLFPGHFYFWYIAAWLLVAAVALAEQGKRRALRAIGLALWLLASLAFVRQQVMLWTLPAQQSLSASVKRVRQEIPSGVTVVTSEYWSALADRDCVIDAVSGHPQPEVVEYLALSGNGSGQPGQPAQFNNRAWQHPGARIVGDDLNPRAQHLLGIRLARSGYGFGAYVVENPPLAAMQCQR